ncbi:MAG TPA: branched-chain amino acid ABC transporter permease [Anaerolineae bacterium]|nr:branched-chain amino acid ABC transporter permease [Anaerolineae bacterium]
MNSEQGIWNRIRGGLRAVGFSPLGLVLLVLLAVLPFVPPFNQEHILRWLIMGAFLAAQAVAFDFTAGYINVVNFGFAAILGVGAYTSAILANTSPVLAVQPGLSPWIGIWCGALLAGLIGFGLGILTLRLRGIFAAVMAWFVGIALMGLVRNMTDLTRGPLGMAPRALLDTTSNRPYFYVILAMLLVIYVTLTLVTRSRYGLAFKAIGQNFDAARASGINPTTYRVFNFTLSAFFAGWLGGFYAHYLGSLTPATVMHTSKTVEVLAMAYIGGRGSLWGGMAIAFPFVFFIEALRSNLTDLPGLHLVIYGILMILVMIYYPGGLAGLYAWAKAKLSAALSRGSKPAVPQVEA